MTEAGRRPFVLIVDDRDEDMSDFVELVRDQGVGVVAVHPRDVDRELLHRASAVVIDQFLEHWDDQPQTPLAGCVPDGLSLAAVLRSHLEGTGDPQRGAPRMAAFVIRTGQFHVLGADLPKAARAHLLAAERDLEWVFDKGELTAPGRPSPAARVAMLARAAAELPDDWADIGDRIETGWLALPSAVPWAEEARWQLEQCRPPRHVVATSTAGRAWLRWFLQRILPYPTFLLDDRRAALVLGLEERSFHAVVAGDSDLSARLASTGYTGACATFLGRRWWRAGLAYLVAQATDRADADEEDALIEEVDVIAALAAMHGAPLVALDVDRPVLRVNAEYDTLPGPVDKRQAARLQPDNWPPYADDAWAASDELDSADDLRDLVVLTDRWRLPAHTPESES